MRTLRMVTVEIVFIEWLSSNLALSMGRGGRVKVDFTLVIDQAAAAGSLSIAQSIAFVKSGMCGIHSAGTSN